MEHFTIVMKKIMMRWELYENNEKQQLPEGTANSCYKIVSPIYLQKLINDFASTVVEHFYLLKM